MALDERDILQVLKAELNFVEKGGYGTSPREPRKEPVIFKDSPSCLNFDCMENPAPCAECALMQFVPADKKGEKFPCHHIPLAREGSTLFGFPVQRGGSQQDMQQNLADWLRSTITRLESQQPPEQQH